MRCFKKLLLVGFLFWAPLGHSGELNLMYWHQMLSDQEASGENLVGGYGEFPEQPFGFASYRGKNFKVMGTPQRFESEDDVPLKTYRFDSYDLAFFGQFTKRIALGAALRVIDLYAEEDFITVKNSSRYLLFVPMAFASWNYDLLKWLTLDVEAWGSTGKGREYMDVIALGYLPISKRLHLGAGYRNNLVRFKKKDEIDLKFRAEGWVAGLKMVF